MSRTCLQEPLSYRGWRHTEQTKAQAKAWSQAHPTHHLGQAAPASPQTPEQEKQMPTDGSYYISGGVYTALRWQ